MLKRMSCALLALGLSVAVPLGAMAAVLEVGSIQRVLLISVDGLHALDVSNYISLRPASTLASLAKTGLVYTQASCSKPSDSFPGLMAQVTGGSPISTGIWYDDAYDRTLSPPGSKCATLGVETMYFEAADKNPNVLNGGGNSDASSIDPTKLPLNPQAGCTPVLPHQFIRVNTIFEVAHLNGLRTAWTDKHPVYEIVNGPSGQGLDELYAPEINSSATQPGVPVGIQIPGGDFTSSVPLVEFYDNLKVKATLNQINGFDAHTGKKKVGVPNLFGMNFQAVSVGQKLTVNTPGGYQDESGTPSPNLLKAMDFVDASLGKMVAALKTNGLFASTLIIVSAKHGQSPIDPNKTNKINPGPGDTLFSGDEARPEQTDDISLIWLKAQSHTDADADLLALAANQDKFSINKIYSGESLKLLFNDPLLDPRTPDIIVEPHLGVIYTGSKKKRAEHGGFSVDDTNVGMVVSNPSLAPAVIKTPVLTTQIAPTILRALGLPPEALQAVQLEKTTSLPDLLFQ